MLMTDIPSDLHNQLRNILLKTGFCASDDRLRSVFAHSALRSWYYHLPEAGSPDARATQAIAFLAEQGDGQDNALVLLLRVLAGTIDPGDQLHQELLESADRLSRILPAAPSV